MQGYNAQAVTTESQLVVAAELTDEANDVHQLQPMLKTTATTLAAAGIQERPGTLLADSGYWSIDNLTPIPDAPELLIPPAKHGRQGKPRKDGKPSASKSDGLRAAMTAYFHAGIQAAREADDKALGAYLVGSSCVQPAYRERPYARLRRLEGRTHGFTRTDANPSTRAWLVTLEAEAHALAGDERSTLRALDEADTAMSRAGEEDTSRRPRVAFFNRNYLVGERGVALARLEQPQAAQEVLEDALSSLDPEAVKTRPRLLAALATAHLRQGNIDEACRLGGDALGLATRQQVGPNLQDVRRLRLELEPWRDSRAVKELDEQLGLVG